MKSSQAQSSTRIIFSHTALRGIAAMYVVIYHYLQVNFSEQMDANAFYRFFKWGDYSVDLFFILSGYILNWVYLSNSSSINWTSYLRARIARILPLYYLTTLLILPIAVYSIINYGSAYVGDNFHIKLLLNTFMISGIITGAEGTFNYPAWSISVEFFCYLAVFPLLVKTKQILTGKQCNLRVLLSLVIVLSLCYAIWYRMPPITISEFQWYTSPLTRGIFGFSIGFILCSIYQELPQRRPGNALINFIVFSSIGIFTLIGLQILPGIVAICVFPVFVYYTAMDRGLAAAIFQNGFLQWLGERSYSIYLWHALCLGYYTQFLKNRISSFLYFGVVIFLIFLISEISYRYFECPFRQLIRRRGLKHDRQSSTKNQH